MQFATTGIPAKAIGRRATVHIAWRQVSLLGRVLSSLRQYKYARGGACDSPVVWMLDNQKIHSQFYVPFGMTNMLLMSLSVFHCRKYNYLIINPSSKKITSVDTKVTLSSVFTSCFTQ